jgi:RHS repeat-associated protein
MTRAHRFLFVALLLALGVRPAVAQTATGTPAFNSFAGGPDVINLSNLNSHVVVPVFQKAGRADFNFTYDLSYDSSVWFPVGTSGSQSWNPVLNWGWRGQTEVNMGYMSHSTSTYTCQIWIEGTYHPPRYTTGHDTIFSNYVYHDSFGISHAFPGISFDFGPCGSGTSPETAVAADGSGYTISSDGSGRNTMISRNGTVTNPPVGATSGSANGTDRNGNQISVSGSGVFTDTLGTTALTVSGSSPLTFTYTAPSSGAASVTMSYVSYTMQTNFGCSGISEYGPTPNTPLVDRITLPDGTFYQFHYEVTPGFTGNVTGRLSSVTLPTGGTISYSYTGGNNGITCADGSAAGLTRTTPDGTWTYARTAGSGAAYTTTINDPQNNQTVIQFQGLYETQRQVYQGLQASGTLLQTINTCYNGSAPPCPGTGITLPITRRSVFTVLTGGLQSEHDDLWNGFGLPSELDDYDFGSAPHGPLLRKVLATYAALGNNINSFRQSVTIQDGAGNTISQINNNFDETAVAATSGTPQLVAISGSRGNLTSVNKYTQSGVFLTERNTYFDTGNVQTATEMNGAQTTYTYGACGNSFPTSVSEPLNVSQSMTWNCTGGAQLSTTDENNQTTTTAFTDLYFWRPASVTDPTRAVTTFTYNGASSVESILLFNGGNSGVDVLTTVDGLGRTKLRQTRQSPSSSVFDTVETDYDNLGRVSRITLPYVATAGVTNSTAPASTTTYDALNRLLQVTDGGGGYFSESYNQNDVFVTQGPAPTGENAKRRQLEYDAMGRLASICEITSATQSGACGQTSSQTGYWTKYTYDPRGRLKSLTQNAQASGSSQTRTSVYDWIGRLTSETNPESGTTSYYYDSDSTCGLNLPGDLVKKVDAAGNTTCYWRDALHRVGQTYSPNWALGQYFVYDSATVNSLTMQNAKSRLAEAYTANCSSCAKITDVGFSYNARGDLTDVYQSTPNSGGYYHVMETYWANGVVSQLGGLPGVPTITYGVDGEGRIGSASASSGQNPVTTATYNAANMPAGVTFGSGDSAGFGYDANTMRMTQYQFNVNGQSLTSALTWSANTTLQKLVITDPFNSADNQTCTYGYDDLTRVTSDNCGSVWSQTFGYDPFGNLTKSGSISFQPTYSAATNQMTSLPGGFTPTYDPVGNVLNDSFHNYTWDGYGNPATIDSGYPDAVTLTYDALGRMVEQNRSGVTTQLVYAPLGGKIALMSGQTLQKALIPLPAKTVAVYNSGGLLYYGHSDFHGSIRLGSTATRNVYFDVAYAPFGETYAQLGQVDAAYTGQRDDTGRRQDTVGGLYDHLFREYSTQGRWPSPDPLGTAATCPKDPQTHNRYAYVRNNPLSFVDPLGAWGYGGFCDSNFDPVCNYCGWMGDFCFIGIGPFISGGGGGGGVEIPQPLPLPFIALAVFANDSLDAALDCGGIKNPISFFTRLERIDCSDPNARHKALGQVGGITTGVAVKKVSTTSSRTINLIGQPVGSVFSDLTFYQFYKTNLGGKIDWTVFWTCNGKKQPPLEATSIIECK